MGKYLTFIIVTLVITAQIAVPFAYAQQAQQQPVRPQVISIPVGTQANTFNTGAATNSKDEKSTDPKALAADAVGCSVGQILGNLVQTGVSAVVGSVQGTATGATAGTGNQRVPVANPEIEGNTAKLASKETGGGSTSLADALISAFTSVGWDAVGFCLANATIHYLTQSTVNWINSGFEGNPVFVDNPEKFFTDLADIELGAFVNELGLGFMCSGVSPKVRIAIVNDYMNRNGGKAFNDKYKCSFDKLGTSVDAFVNNFNNGGINAFVEYVYNPASRPSTAYLAAQDELNRRIQKTQGKAEWTLRTSTFLSWDKCEETKDNKTGKTIKTNCKTQTPGKVIEEQANNAINSPRNRLEIADEFDEVIGALVNQLIRSALSDSLEPVKGGQNDKKDDDEEDEQTIQTPVIVNQNPNQTTPAPLPAPSGVCVVATTTVAVDQPVEVGVTPRGGNGSYLFDWMGGIGFPTSTPANRLIISFATTTNASDIDVRIRSAGKAVLVQCPAIRVVPAVPLQVSCDTDDSTVGVGDAVTWSSDVSGGTGYYTYKWSEDVNPSMETSQDNTVTYNSKGTYFASVEVTSGSQKEIVACKRSVRVR